MVATKSFLVGALAATIPFTAAYMPTVRDTSLALFVAASSISSASAYAIDSFSIHQRDPKKGTGAAAAAAALADKAKKNKGNNANNAAANATAAATNATAVAATADNSTAVAAGSADAAANSTTSATGSTTTSTSGKKNGAGKNGGNANANANTNKNKNKNNNNNNANTVTITESSESLQIIGKREATNPAPRRTFLSKARRSVNDDLLVKRHADVGFVH